MKLLTTFLVALICCSNINGQAVKNDTSYFKLKLIKPEVHMPESVPEPDSITYNPLNFYVLLNGDSIAIKFNDKVFENVSIEELDTFIKKNNVTEVSPRKAIVNRSSTTSYDNIKKVVDVFISNSINRFNLLTQPTQAKD